MRDFKFFEKGTLDMLDGQTYATASFNDDTPEGVMGRRRLYHTNLPVYQRFREDGVITQQQYNLNRDVSAERERVRRHLSIDTDNQIRLFQTTTVTTVNPKFWTKVKIVLQESWRLEPIGVVVVSILSTLVTIIGIAKILSIW
jgi:hypothetical protein